MKANQIFSIMILLCVAVSQVWGANHVPFVATTQWLATDKPSTVTTFKKKDFWQTYQYIDGLADNKVTRLLEADDGTLWVGTWDGSVSHFDGQTWTTYNKDSGLAGNAIIAMLQTQDGKVWAGSYGGLSCYDGQTWTSLTQFSGTAAHSLLQTHDGMLWVGTIDNGLFYYDGQTWHNITTNDGLAHNTVPGLLQTQDGMLWAGTLGGLSRYDGQRWQTVIAEGLTGGWIKSLLQSQDGRLWVIASGLGLFCYDGQTWQNITTNEGLANNSVESITQTRDGILWVGTRGGLSYYDGKSWKTLTRVNGLASNVVLSLVQARDGALWIGTWGGISRYDRQQWQTFTQDDKSAGNFIRCILQAHDDSLWVGAGKERAREGGGLYRYDGQQWQTFTTENGLADNDIQFLFQTQDEAIWIGTFGSGVCRYDGKRWVTFTKKDGLASNYVTSISQTRDGKLWVCTGMWLTSRGALNCYDGHTWHTFTEAGTRPLSLLQTQDGALWIGTIGKGLLRYALGETQSDGDSWQRFTTEDGLVNNNVSVLLQTSDDVLWLGTFNGLSRYEGPLDSLNALRDKKRWRTFTEKDGLIRKMINTLFQTPDGKLWVGTEEGGFNVYDGKCFQSINTEDGLVGNGVRSIVQAPDGALWIGTTDGISRLVPNKTPPNPHIRRVIADDAKIDNPKGNIRFVGPVKRLLIEYRGITFHTRKGGIKYLTQLVKVGQASSLPRKQDACATVDGWSKPTNEERVEYTNLEPGDYTFKMQAIDRWLNYSEIASLRIKIVPPFYMRAAFLVPTVSLGVILLTALVIFATAFFKHRKRISAYQRAAVQELQDANQVQMGLMPETAPPIEGVEIAGKCLPANTVSGDFFDYLEGKGANEVTLVVADVTGKAMKGAMNAVMTDGILRTTAKEQGEFSPASLMVTLNDVLKDSMERSMNVTMLIGMIDAKTKTFTLANAGHHALPILLRDGEIEYLKAKGMPLGMMAGIAYNEEQFSLQSGDVLILMTDGIIEAQDSEEQLYSDSGRLEQIISQFTQDSSPETIVDELIADAMDFGGDKETRDDDMTVVVAKIQ